MRLQSKSLENEEYIFFNITPRFTLTRSGSTY